MFSDRSLIEREMQRVELQPFTLARFHRLRERKQRNKRIRAGAVALVVAAVGMGALIRPFSSGLVPADDPRSPFLGSWVSTDGDGSTQTMTIRARGDDAVEIEVHDDFAARCSGLASTMTGSGRIKDGTAIVIPAPVYTCDAGSQAENPNTPPLDESLRDWTLVLDLESDTFSDSVGGVWVREGTKAPSPKPAASGQMWPQTSYQEVVEAQQLADAGDPRYLWQVDPQLAADDFLYPWDSEIVERFLREELGWEKWGIGGGGTFAGQRGDRYNEIMLIRCAPGGTNPLYPEMPADVRGCAPTIDDFRYETVRIDLDQPGLRGPSGIWVVTRWEMLQPVEPRSVYDHLFPHESLQQVVQVAPPSNAEVTALLQAFLGARVDGSGAERYLHRHPGGWDDQEVPIVYATTGGSPYERYEIERVQGPTWPTGWVEFRVRLFAEDGTEVEQSFIAVRQEDGRLGLMHASTTEDLPTTEDGQPIPVPYRFLDGEVTFAVATPDPWDEPWDGGAGDLSTFMLFNLDRSAMMIMADPLPVDPDCKPGPAPADAEALVRSIRSNPDIDSTVPVAVRLGGVDALRMDVAFGRRAGCGELGLGPAVLEGTSFFAAGSLAGVMRLYLLDLPEGMSARILGIAIAAPEVPCTPDMTPCFQRVIEAAAPVLDSFEFHTR
jgi:hypothetical protein